MGSYGLYESPVDWAYDQELMQENDMSIDNTNKGAIWPNKDMREGKQDPEYTGSLNVDGVEFWISAWKRKPDANPKAPALRFTVKPKEAKRPPYGQQTGGIDVDF